MYRISAAAIAASLLLVAAPASADDFEDSIAAALEAYRAGDIKGAKEEIDFAAQILAQMKAESLGAYLPEPMDGWERNAAEDQSQAMAAMGGGQMVSAVYMRGNEQVEIQLMAGNQMVTAMGAMFSNPAVLGSMGKVKRINRQKAVITREGDVQAMIGKVMVQISGSADVEAKEAYFAALDTKALEEF